MIKQYETAVIFTPVLSDAEVKKSISKYKDVLKAESAEIIHEDHWGLKQLAYPIRKKTTGIYHIMEYKVDGEAIDKMELLFRRDPEILRFLTIRLDKYSIKYNEDKRNGLIGRKNNPQKETAEATPEAGADQAADAPKTETDTPAS